MILILVSVTLITSEVEHFLFSDLSFSADCCLGPSCLAVMLKVFSAREMNCWGVVTNGSWSCVESSWVRSLNWPFVPQ